MARVNVYLPDDLAEEARAAGLNISNLTQAAIREALNVHRVNAWLDSLDSLPRTTVSHEAVIEAVHAAKDELERRD